MMKEVYLIYILIKHKSPTIFRFGQRLSIFCVPYFSKMKSNKNLLLD